MDVRRASSRCVPRCNEARRDDARMTGKTGAHDRCSRRCEVAHWLCSGARLHTLKDCDRKMAVD
jgi:hypothetical protein